MKIPFNNTYSKLPEVFFQKVLPSSGINPSLIAFNDELADQLDIENDHVNDEELAKIFSGMMILENSEPLAMAYAGHQFGNFVPQLGDGRAVLLGEVVDKNSVRYDIQLKGAGQTKFSRRGDGKSALGPVIREYLLSEAMYALNIPTTRALAAVTTGDSVMRHDLEPAGIFTRVSKGHVRIGTFEYFIHKNDIENLKVLADYSINRFYSCLNDHDDKYFEFFKAVAKNKLSLVASWMGIGFIHGVMNTDNTSICGETIDFGPCAFMDQFSFGKVFSSIDRQGRYAYANQLNIALWNLSSLANCLIPIMTGKPEDNIKRFNKEFENLTSFSSQKWLEIFSKKLGIVKPMNEDHEIIKNFLSYLQENKLDFTNSFRELPKKIESNEKIYQSLLKRIKKQDISLEESIQLMNKSNPVFIPRNHHVQKAIEEANQSEYEYFHYLNKAYKNPFDENYPDLTIPPKPNEIVHQTFCGT